MGLIDEIKAMDGRKRCPDAFPLRRLPNARAPKVSTVKWFLTVLEKERQSTHSRMGVLLPYALQYREEMRYDYELSYANGWSVLKITTPKESVIEASKLMGS